MAAVLFNACGEICNGACEVCGAACQFPCRACNTLCGGCGNVCESACYTFGRLCSSPFSLFVTVAAVFNLPVVYMGLTSGAIGGDTGLACHGTKWLVMDALFAAVNVAAAVYMAIVVVQQDQPTLNQDIEQNNNNNDNTLQKNKEIPTTAFGRAGHMLCYDPWMAIYILTLLGFFVWLWTGAIWSLNGTVYENCDADSSVQGKVAIALGFGWAFIFFGVGALCISLCCAYCYGGDNNDASTSSAYYGLYQDATTTPAQGYAAPAANSKTDAKTASTTGGGGLSSFFGGKSSTTGGSIPTVAATPAPPAKTSSPPVAQAVLY